jgi:Protoporphyrinogen oxidase
MMQKKAIIIGAGPAGLTAAYELLTRTNIKPIIIEKTNYMGGISKTVNYKGNRIDIGGHRFFSKSDRVMQWWFNILTPEPSYQKATPNTFTPARRVNSDDIMLIRQRKSRIYYTRQFFDYPVSLSPQTLKALGFFKTCRIGLSYTKQMLFPIKNEQNLEDFFINRFGKELYETFFKSYTEKVWGLPCNEISASWGAQRIHGVSISKAIKHALRSLMQSKKDIAQKNTETSLIEQFLYPKFGPGQMWERVADQVKALGGTILTEHCVDKFHVHNNTIVKVDVKNSSGEITQLEGDYLFSSMPIKDFVQSLNTNVPEEIKQISDGLPYRDFLTVGLLLNKIKIKEKDGSPIKDNWIYIQEPDVLVGRLQIFNNWSPYMVADPSKMWIGLEYFCNEGDSLWSKSDEELIQLAKQELAKIDIIDEPEVIDATVIKQEKAYPAYFGTYEQFDILKNYLNTLNNVFFIGRNGMHRYNNQDHSMLSAMQAVDNILNNTQEKENIWMVNAEKEYHERK